MQSFVKHPNFSFTQKYKCCISETESFSSANLTLGYVKKKKTLTVFQVFCFMQQ